MKTKSLILAAIVLLSSASIHAGDGGPLNTGFVVVPVQNNQVFKVIYKGESVGRVRLTIYNENGETIYAESIYRTNGFIYPMNFAGLSSGIYTLELIDAGGKKSEKINYTSK